MLYKVTNIHKHYKMGNVIIKALNGVDLTIEEGKFYSIVGPSGSGKSTLLHLLGILDNPTEGEILLDGINVAELNHNEKSELRNMKLGFIFQQFYLIPVLNVSENIEVPLLQNRKNSNKEIKEIVAKLVHEVQLDKYKKHKPTELSGGQQQRVAIARALTMKPKVILADEPTANLDSKTSMDIIKLMKNLNKEENISFIFSTHDPMIMDFADHIIKLTDGKIV